ncbi:MAG: hypothetical protein IJ263_09600 [Paludibacteraceae bacterium]|nr:hypothetical protein [Paludibacteraceae bacterium]
MAKKTTIAATSTALTVNSINVKNIRNLMGAIDAKITSGGTNLYDKNRDLIKSLFNPAIPYNVDVVYKRLVVIDSLYSTNMNQRYYGIEDMANTIFGHSFYAGIASDNNLRDKVQDFRNKLFPTSHPIANVFGMSYGIHKNLAPAGSAMSLLSKYFYYLLLTGHPSDKLGFPIYDSLASDMYPIVCKYVYASGTPRKIVNVKTIDHLCDYFLALDQLRISIGISYIGGRSLQEFDLLDAYLWRMGKFNGNNFSLLLDKTGYTTLIGTAGAAGKTSSDVIDALGAYRKSNGCPSLIANPLFANLWDHANDLGI